MEIQPLKVPKLYERIAAEILDLIRREGLQPGSKLPAERSLATLMGVSRSSLREALSSLELAGVLEITVGSGAYIAKPRKTNSNKSAIVASGEISPFELLQVRRLVEPEAAYLAALHASRAEKAQLRRIFVQLGREMRAHLAMSEADMAFHMTIAQASHQMALRVTIAKLFELSKSPLNARMEVLFVSKARRRDNIPEHEAILRAIESGDADKARGAMRFHIRQAEKERLKALEKPGLAA